MRLLRRELLLFASAAALPSCKRDCPPRASAPAGALGETVTLLEDSPPDRIFDAVAKKLAEGLDPNLLLGALLVAGVRTLRPAPIGGAYHSVMMVDAIARCSAQLSDTDRLYPHFAAVGTFARAYDKQQHSVCWELGVEPEALPASEDPAARLRAAVDAGDSALADQAALALYRTAPRSVVVDALLVVGTRRVRYLGHEAIFAAKGISAIDRVGWENALPLVRALAVGVCNAEVFSQTEAGPDSSALLPANEARAAALPGTWAQGAEAKQASLELLVALRDADADGASAEVVRLLGLGVGIRSIWDGVTLAGAEVAMQFGENHGFTAIQAARHGAALASSDPVRKLMLLQAAARVPLMRESYRLRKVPELAVQLDALEPLPVSSAEEVIDSADSRTRVRRAYGFLESPANEGALRETLLAKLVRSGNEEHQWKQPMAALEDAEGVHPDFRRTLVAMAAFNSPHLAEKESDFHLRATEALART